MHQLLLQKMVLQETAERERERERETTIGFFAYLASLVNYIRQRYKHNASPFLERLKI
jgi:hypothetical protein